MDKCKYQLNINGVTLNFNSDAELTEFVKRNLGEDENFKKLTPIKPGVTELFESNPELANQVYEALGFNFRYTSEKWRDDPTKENKATYINIKGTPSNQEFQVKKDIEEGFYSVHFKTEQGKLTKEQIQILVDAIASQVPIGGKLSTWGEITKGGISGLNRFLNNGFKKVGEREIKDREGNPIIIPILEKVEKSNLEQQAQQQYSQYLDTIFPDNVIVYRGSEEGRTNFEKRGFFTDKLSYAKEYAFDKGFVSKSGKEIVNIFLINTANVKSVGEMNTESVENEPQDSVLKGVDKGRAAESGTVYATTSKNLYELGSKKDIQGFKDFVQGKQFQKLTAEEYSLKKPIKKSILKFSKDGGVETKQTKVLKSIQDNNAGYSENFVKQSEFMKMKHSLGEGDPKLLAPIFDNSNMIVEKTKELLDTKYKDQAKVEPLAAEKAAKAEAEADIRFDNLVYNFSPILSKIMQEIIGKEVSGTRIGRGINDDMVNSIIDETIKYNNKVAEERGEKFEYSEDELKEIKTRVTEQLTLWRNKNISNTRDEILPNMFLNKQYPYQTYSGISSPVSYLTISPDGTTDIYEFKASRQNFNEWDSAKKLQADYKLGINRQILEDMLPGDMSTKYSSLYITPIVLPTDVNGYIDLNRFYIGENIERSKTPNLEDDGIITKNLRKLIPAKIKTNPKESVELIDKIESILKAFFPKYNFRTKYITKDAEKYAERIISNSKGNAKLRMRNALTDKYIEEENTEEGRVKFKEKVAEYFKSMEENKDSQMIKIVKILKESKKKGRIADKEASEGFVNTFKKYLSNDWELVDNRPEYLATGILLFVNNTTMEMETVSVTVNLLSQINNLGLGDTILGKFYKNNQFQDIDKIWRASTTNIEIIKALTVLNTNPDLVKGYSFKNAVVYDHSTGRADWSNDFKGAFYNFNLLLKEISKDNPVENHFGKTIKTTPIEKIIWGNLIEAVSATKDTYLEGEFNSGSKNQFKNQTELLNYLLDLRKKLHKHDPNLERMEVARIPDYGDPIIYLDAILAQSISWLSGITNNFDFIVPDYGISKSDFTYMLKSWIFGEAPKYDSKGKKVVGMVQGAQFSTTDALPSDIMTKLNELVALAQNKITWDYNIIKNKIVNVTKAMYAELGRSKIEKAFIGAADRYHEVFFETNGNQISQDFILKNPWKDNTLNTLQKKYLKQYVHLLYYQTTYSNKDLDTLEKFENSEEFQMLQASGDIKDVLKVPLMKKQSLSAMKTLTTEGFRKYVGNVKDNILHTLDFDDRAGSEQDEEQRLGVYNSTNGLGKMHNRFSPQSNDEFRNKLIEKHGVSFWEVNLDTILLKFTFENLREDYFNQILPKVDAGIQLMKFYGHQSGQTEETQKALETVWDQIKVGVFNISPIRGKESEDVLNIVRSIQKMTSFMVLALRPASAVKELIVGTIKNTSYAWSKIYGDDSFDGKYLSKAYMRLFSPTDIDLVMAINNIYRVANRDLNQIVDKTKVDRHGLNFFGSFLYWSNTAPDYINRLALFMSKMERDGNLDAHHLDELGNLIYDPTKDKRFSYYFEMRKQYGMEAHKTDTKYNDQRALYLTHIEMLNKEIISSKEKILTEEDMIPRAYTHAERESIVTFTELAYGYYNHERTPLIKHLPQGILFGQFMTFWPAKMKYYFGTDESKTKKGKMVHKYEMVDGKKVYYYAKYSKGEHGEPIREEILETDIKPDDVVMKSLDWVGDPFEGLLFSLGMTTRALFTGELNETPEYRIQNAKLMLHDLLVAMIAIMLGIFLFTKDKDVEGATSTWDDMGHLERQGARILMRATREFDPFDLIGSVQTTPSFIAKLEETKRDFKNLFAGNSNTERFFRRAFNFLEVIPQPLARN